MPKIVALGQAVVRLPAGQKIAVLTQNGTAQISQTNTSVNSPPIVTQTMQGPNKQEFYGTFLKDIIITIDALNDDVFYEVGVSPFATAGLSVQPVWPTKTGGAQTLTAADLLGGLVLGNPYAGGVQIYTLPLAADLNAAMQINKLQSFKWSLININIVAGNNIQMAGSATHGYLGGVFIFAQNVTTGNSATFETVKLSDTIYGTYRLS